MSTFSNRRRHSGNAHAIHEINVMPLVDLLLQLFIAVIIFFPVVEYGMGINLPKATMETVKAPKTRTVSMDRSGNFYLNDVRKTPQQLRADLAALANQNPPVTIMVKADQDNNYGRVMTLLKELHDAKITSINLITQEENAPKSARR